MDGGRCMLVCDVRTCFCCHSCRQFTQLVIEGNDDTPACGAIEQCALRHRGVEHFLQADCLRAELHFISAVRLWLSSLVFNRKGSGRLATKFHGVGFAHNAQRPGPQSNAARNMDAMSRFRPPCINGFMQ